MRKITFIGGEGCGKTVLLAMLSHRHRERRPDRVSFYPLGRTFTQVGAVISTLESGEWPASTVQGASEEWRWRLEFPGGGQAELLARDCAGQDLRRFFNGLPAPRELESLRAELEASDIVLFLVNLGDFIGQPEARRLENELLLKEALDRLATERRRCALVFTQVDRYGYLFDKHGSWPQVVQAVAPTLHAGHIAPGRIAVLGVAAVANTEPRYVPKENSTVVLPVRGFASRGLDELMGWLMKSHEELARAQAKADRWEKIRRFFSGKWFRASVGVLAALTVATCAWPSPPKKPKPPIMVTCSTCEGRGKVGSVFGGTPWIGEGRDCGQCHGVGRVPLNTSK